MSLPSPAPQPPLARPRAVIVVVGVGTLLNTLAGSSVNLALPVIGRELDIAVELSRWVALAFMLVVATLLLGVGRASDLWGHRRVYQIGFSLFGAASLLCGLARPFWALLAGRLLQGVGAAATMSAAPALLTTTFPAAQRGKALGVAATATYVGLTFGPPLGGLLIAALGWRWIFWFNVPVAALMVPLGQLYLPRAARRHVPLDRPGLATLTLALPLLLIGLTEGQEWGWGSARTLGVLGAGALALAVFVRVERHREHPLVDLRLFSAPLFTGAVLAALCNYVAIFVPIILLPFWLLEALRLPPAHAGLVLGVMPLVMALVATPAGTLSDRLGTRGLCVAGMLLQSAALVGMALLGVCPPERCSALHLAVWLALLGLGTGTFISPNSSALMGGAPRAQQGTAGGVLALARTTGMMAGISLGTAVFRALGGHSGRAWTTTDVTALRAALAAAAGVSLLGAVAAALRGSGQERR